MFGVVSFVSLSFHVETVLVWVRKFITSRSGFFVFNVFVTVLVMITSIFEPSAFVLVVDLVFD